jgi:hypothetical protein
MESTLWRTHDRFAVSTNNSVWLRYFAISKLEKSGKVPKSEMMLPTIYNVYYKGAEIEMQTQMFLNVPSSFTIEECDL